MTRFAQSVMKIASALVLLIGAAANAQTPEKADLFPIDVEGRAKALQTVEIIPLIDGVVVERHFTLGQEVKKGDVLIKIDQKPFEIEVDQARIKLKNANFVLETVEKEMARIQDLVDKKLYPLKNLYDLKMRHDLSLGEVEEARAELSQAEFELSRTVIKSPIAGFISDVNVDVGDFVSPELGIYDRERGQLMTLVKYDPIRVVIGMDTKTDIEIAKLYIAKQKPEFNFELSLPTGEKFPHPGKLVGSYHRANPETGKIQHELVFPNPDHLLIPGYNVKVRITDKRPGQ